MFTKQIRRWIALFSNIWITAKTTCTILFKKNWRISWNEWNRTRFYTFFICSGTHTHTHWRKWPLLLSCRTDKGHTVINPRRETKYKITVRQGRVIRSTTSEQEPPCSTSTITGFSGQRYLNRLPSRCISAPCCHSQHTTQLRSVYSTESWYRSDSGRPGPNIHTHTHTHTHTLSLSISI